MDRSPEPLADVPILDDPRRRSTISDVARRAGVSIKTVSRVARHEPNVSEKTRQRVQAVMDAMRYRPTIAARSLTSSQSSLLGLVYDNPNPMYSLELLRGAQQAARALGCHLIAEPLDIAKGGIGDAIRELVVQANLEGVIVPPPLCDLPEVAEALSELGRSYALIAPTEAPAAPGCAVSMDDVAAAHAITRHLQELGHRQIAFVNGLDDTAASASRLAGFEAAMADAGLPVPADYIVVGDFRLHSGLEAGHALLALDPAPTAIFACNDEMAAGVMIAAFQRGLAIPDDVSIAGFDDSPTASAVWPQLTTIRQPIAAMAAAAAEAIVGARYRSPGEGALCTSLDYELVVRGSTGPVTASAA